MKKALLLCVSIMIGICAIGQTQSYPKGFTKAKVPPGMNRTDIKVPIHRKAVDNGESNPNAAAIVNVPYRATSSTVNLTNADLTEIVGSTKYDLQTNSSVSNRIVWNADNTISVAWTYSPDANNGSNPPYPFRGTGYNYFDGTSWLYQFPVMPTVRIEPSRTGFTNIVVTAAGKEMTIAHQAVSSTTFNKLTVSWRGTKGGFPMANPFTFSSPWGDQGFHTWAKACGNVTGEYVYVIWHGSGVPATTTTPPNIVNGQNGPLMFGRSTDGGVTWDSAKFIPEIDSNFYCGFGGDSYSIDAYDSIVAITVGDTYSDLVLLKSTDYGSTWSKTIIWKHPIPKYSCSNVATYYLYNDNIPDTVHSHAGDSKVLIDNNGMAHVSWSELHYHDADSTDEFYNPHYGTDNLLYWNESMGPDTTSVWDTLTYGHPPFVAIAAVQDLNGDSVITIPSGIGTGCTSNLPWGQYLTGITGMPSMGIDQIGNIYISYQTINELADTTAWHMAHRHIYLIAIPYQSGIGYDPAMTTYPYNIIPSIAQGGDGENEEAVFGTIARRVDWNTKMALILYQQDQAPGHSLDDAGSCAYVYNLNKPNNIKHCRVDLTIPMSIAENSKSEIQVGQNYPNPADDITNVNVYLRKPADVKVEISNLIGKVVYKESKGRMNEGTHTITMNTSSLSNGVYIYTISAGEAKTTRKMVIQ